MSVGRQTRDKRHSAVVKPASLHPCDLSGAKLRLLLKKIVVFLKILTSTESGFFYNIPTSPSHFLGDRKQGLEMEGISGTPVRRVVQWSLKHDELQLRVNPAYPRVASGWNKMDTGRYLLGVMNGTDISVLIINVCEQNAYIVDGAARICALVNFQQGRIPIVVRFEDIPDGVSFRPHGVPAELYTHNHFEYKDDTLVEAFYSDLSLAQQRAFLEMHVDIVQVRNLSLEDEQRLYWQNNCMVPSSPLQESIYNETLAFEAVAQSMNAPQVRKLLSLLHVVESAVDAARVQVVRAAILSFTHSIVHDLHHVTDQTISSISSTEASTSVESSTSDIAFEVPNEEGEELV